MRIIVFMLLAASPLSAEKAMNAAAFDAYTAGKTITFGRTGEPAYGVEQYQPNRRVVWQFIGGDCSNGVWYESKVSICFRYDFYPESKCWKFYDDPKGLRAEFVNRPESGVFYQAQDSQETLSCPGPDLGS